MKNLSGWHLGSVIACALGSCLFPGVAHALSGTVSPVTISGSRGAPITFNIYLPPGYNAQSTRRFPVVYHMHGINRDRFGVCLPDTPTGQLSTVPNSHENAVLEGMVEPVILVFPDGYCDAFWADSVDGQKPAESDVVDAIIPYVDANYRTQAQRGRRIVQGFSMGGFGAAKFGAKFPELFGATVIYDGALLDWAGMQVNHPDLASSIFGNDENYFDEFSPWFWVEENSETLEVAMPFRQAVGSLTPNNEAFRTLLLQNGITPSYIDTPAGHDLLAVMNSADPPGSSTTAGEVSWQFIQAAFDTAPTIIDVVSIAAEDGWVLESTETSGIGGSSNSAGANLLVGDNVTRQQFRSILSFDTASIPDGATILSASVTLTRTGGAGSTATLGTLRGDVRSGTFGGAALANSDFEAPASVVGGVPAIAIPANGQSTTAELSAPGLSAVNASGRTQIRLRFTTDDDNDGVADNVSFASSNHATAGFRPVLRVTYH